MWISHQNLLCVHKPLQYLGNYKFLQSEKNAYSNWFWLVKAQADILAAVGEMYIILWQIFHVVNGHLESTRAVSVHGSWSKVPSRNPHLFVTFICRNRNCGQGSSSRAIPLHYKILSAFSHHWLLLGTALLKMLCAK